MPEEATDGAMSFALPQVFPSAGVTIEELDDTNEVLEDTNKEDQENTET